MAFYNLRIIHILCLFIVTTSLLASRLFFLQVMDSTKLTQQCINGRIQEVNMEVARGEILDRNGISLTDTAWHFSVLVFPSQISEPIRTADELTKITGIPFSKIISLFRGETKPFKLKTDVDAVTAQKVNKKQLPGVVALAEKVRYGSSPVAAHVVGYINAVDNHGMSGIEKDYDEILRGSQPDSVAALVDAGQQIIPGLGYKRLKLPDAEEPANIILTLDSRIQHIVEVVMDKYIHKGSVLILRPSTGEILAMGSRPAFDANHLGHYLNREDAPLLNRTIAAYQPGSVFKLAIAAAALETKQVSLNDVFFDKGYIDVNNLRFKGWDFERGGRGKLTFLDAMAYSSNPVLIEVGQKLGPETIVSFAQRLGFGHKTKLNLDGESGGNLPEANQLYPGDLANLSIGQGTLEATPLQIAMLISTIVNDGVKIDPLLVQKIITTNGKILRNFQSDRKSRILSKATTDQLRQMMAAVTEYGTGQAAEIEGYGSAGKTGTAETGRTTPDGKGINHAWFAGYAPLEKPQYVLVVFVEEGMSGGDVAAPIFREIMTEILK